MTLVCIDCGRPIAGAAYGAGDGTGRRFRCLECHDRSDGTPQDSRGATDAKRQASSSTAVEASSRGDVPGVTTDRDARARFDRWLEESHDLLGRVVPAAFDDRERLKARLEGAERECERLRRQVEQLGTELAQLRAKEAAVAEAFSRAATLLGTGADRIGNARQP
jgi:chromosome segregation ATPase